MHAINLMVRLAKWRAADMMDEPSSYIGRWLKMKLKHVIMLVEMGIELAENIKHAEFCIYGQWSYK